MKTSTSLLLIAAFSLCMAIVVFLCLLSISHADPYLICDPQTNVTHYVVTMDGDTSTLPAFDLADGTVMLKYDLAVILPGPHNVEVKSKNVWGESTSVPFDFTKALPAAPDRLCIE